MGTASIHPEWLARFEGEPSHRFAVTCADRDWYHPRTGRIARRHLASLRSRFDQLAGQLLDRASDLRLTRVPKKRGPDPARGALRIPLDLLAESRPSDGGSTRVDLANPRVRSDLEFWWQLCSGHEWRALILAAPDRLDETDFFRCSRNPIRKTLRSDMAESTVELARSLTADGARIALLPQLDSRGDLELLVVTTPTLVAQLARRVLEAEMRRDPVSEHRLARYDPGDPPLDFLWEALKELRSLEIFGSGPEAWLLNTLRAGAGSDDPRRATLAIGAAEAIACLEGRPATAQPDIDAPRFHCHREAIAWSFRQDSVAESVLRAAEQTALTASPDVLIDPMLRSPEARGEYAAVVAAGLADLRKRLAAAVRSRQVRLTAANARPKPATPRTPDELVRPEHWSLLEFFALGSDLVSLTRALRDEPDLRIGLVVPGADGDGAPDLHPIQPWEDLATVLLGSFPSPGHFDRRELADSAARQSGLLLYFWWDGIASPPVLRDGIVAHGWGHARMMLRGACRHPAPDGDPSTPCQLVLRSTFESPTGTELGRPRYAAAGPWREVDWPELRKRAIEIRRLLTRRQATAWLDQRKPVPLLAGAHEAWRAGALLAGPGGWPWPTQRVRRPSARGWRTD